MAGGVETTTIQSQLRILWMSYNNNVIIVKQSVDIKVPFSYSFSDYGHGVLRGLGILWCHCHATIAYKV